MMVGGNDHRAVVDAWLKRSGKGLSAEGLLRLFDRAFAAVWRRAQVTLGEVTLRAVLDRVLHGVAERFPTFSALRVEEGELQSQALHERARSLQREHLVEGIQLVLAELLSIIGNLTAEILTPALHEELSKIAPAKRGPDLMEP